MSPVTRPHQGPTAAPPEPSAPGAAPRWVDVCALDDIPFDAGVAALLDAGTPQPRQIALFRIGDSQDIHAVANFDPFSGANVLGRGILCHIRGEPAVASPVLKQHFSLRDGRCFEDPEVSIPVYAVRVCDGRVLVASAPGEG